MAALPQSAGRGCVPEVMTVAAVPGERAGRVLPGLPVLTACPRARSPSRQFSRPRLHAQISSHGFLQVLSGSELALPDTQSPQGWWAAQALLGLLLHLPTFWNPPSVWCGSPWRTVFCAGEGVLAHTSQSPQQ